MTGSDIHSRLLALPGYLGRRSVSPMCAGIAQRIGPAVLIILLLTSGCAGTFPITPDSEHTYAIAADRQSALTEYLAPDQGVSTTSSALALLGSHRDALVARLGLIDLSEHSLDLQYYIWKGDTAGGLLLERLLRAADRGVRVRLLLDDYASGRQDFELFVIDAHPNIEVRMYNPFSYGRSGTLSRTFAFFGNFRRLNHRMHNKAFIVDNQAAILGGRNIGDKDFGLSSKMNSRDMDVFVAGPVVPDISESFDRFWNSEWSVRIERIAGLEVSEGRVRRERDALHAWSEELTSLPWNLAWDGQALREGLVRWRESWIWADTKLVVDEPRKDQLDPAKRERDLVRDLREVNDQSDAELLVVAPYLIPSEGLLEEWREWIAAGRRVVVLTNSLRSNNVSVAQYGYMRWRRRLIEAGVELYELRADAASRSEHSAQAEEDTLLSLHAKLVVWDDTTVYIGSLNLDPRSVNLNTEIGLLIESPELAERLMAELDEDVRPKNSYHVGLRSTEDSEPSRRLVWRYEDDGVEIVTAREPGLTMRHRIANRFFRLLPIEDQL